MPRLPTYDNLIAPSAIPDARQSIPAATADAFMGSAAGLAALGKGMVHAGDVYQRARKEADETRVQAATTDLLRAADDSMYGDKGLITTRRQASAIGSADQWVSDFGKAASQIGESLTPEQKMLFQRQVEATQRSYYHKARAHEGSETVAWRDATYKESLGQGLDTVGRNYDDPGIVALQVTNALNALRQRPEYVSATGPDGATVRQQMELSIEGGFHARVVQSALNAGNTALADAWLKTNSERIPLKLRDELQQRLKPATDFAAGKAIAADALTRLDAGEDVSKVERWIMDSAPSKEAHSVAQSLLREQQDARKRKDAEQIGGVFEKFEMAPSRSTMNKMLADPAFQAMPAEARGRAVKYMRSELEQADDRARVRRNEKYRTPEIYAMALAELESPGFANKSRNEIRALADSIGPENTVMLLREHAIAQKTKKSADDSSMRFQIDKDLILVPNEISGKSHDVQQKAFRWAVEYELSLWKDAHKGKIPTIDEQRKIVASASADWVKLNPVMWNSDVKAYEVVGDSTVKAMSKEKYSYISNLPGDLQRAAYSAKSIADIPSGFITEVRKKAPSMTDEMVLKTWKMLR